MTWAANASLISTRSMSSMAIPARVSACRDACTGPSPMISGDRAVMPEDTIRASGGAVVERAAVGRGHRAVRAEGRLERGDLLDRDARARAVVGGDHGAVG